MRIEEGAAGYGVYWMILELLRDAPGFKFSRNPKAIAFAINEHDVELVLRVINNFGLFDFDDDDLLWSPWLHDAMEAYNDKKTRLQEAGRRGAAKRWAAAHGTDGQAIATPSLEDGQAIAYNTIQHNITKNKETTPPGDVGKEWEDILKDPGEKIPEDIVEYFCTNGREGYNTGYIAQVCWHYGVGENTFNFICERSNNADLNHPLYKKFCALVRRIQVEKFTPKKPDAFFLKKLFE